MDDEEEDEADDQVLHHQHPDELDGSTVGSKMLIGVTRASRPERQAGDHRVDQGRAQAHAAPGEHPGALGRRLRHARAAARSDCRRKLLLIPDSPLWL